MTNVYGEIVGDSIRISLPDANDWQLSKSADLLHTMTPLVELERVLAERGQCLPFEPPQFRDARDGQDNTKRAVEFASVADGVEVRAEQEDFRAGFFAGIVTDEIADGVNAGLHSRRAHPGGDQLIGPAHRGRSEGAGDAPRLVGDAGKRREARHHLLGNVTHASASAIS